MRALVTTAVLLAISGTSMAHAQPGWRTLDLGGGRSAVRYLPSSVRACDALPLMLFLHGAGGTPAAYQTHLQPDAESLGVIVVMPQASGAGWSGADVETINGALDAVAAELNVDTTRTYFAGHSAGGAFAYLITYGGSTGVAGVFSMSAPYYMVSSISDPAHTAPIRMYYGADDPNYTGGSAGALEAQWARLGVPYETDVQAGYGHSTWPPASIRAGFDFLLARRYPGTPPASRCGDVDAGTGGGVDGGADAGAVAADDAGAVLDAGRARDAGRSASDASIDAGRRPGISSGCGCRVAASRSTLPPLALLAWVAVRRRRRARS